MSDDLLPEDDDLPKPGESGDQARTRLAGERTYLAGERTLLAWVRTSVAMMGFGFLVARFGLFLREMAQMREGEAPTGVGWSSLIGTALVAVGATINLYAVIEHAQFLRRFRDDRTGFTKRSLFPLLLALTMSALGVALAIYLMTVR
jgi:putative membrane protein